MRIGRNANQQKQQCPTSGHNVQLAKLVLLLVTATGAGARSAFCLGVLVQVLVRALQVLARVLVLDRRLLGAWWCGCWVLVLVRGLLLLLLDRRLVWADNGFCKANTWKVNNALGTAHWQRKHAKAIRHFSPQAL